MNSTKCTGGLNIIERGVVGVFVLGGLLTAMTIFSNIDLRKQQIAPMFSGSIGFPAGEETLKNDQVYFVTVSIVDPYPSVGMTNYLSVMKEVGIRDSSFYLHSPTNRLFLLQKNIRQGGYYRAVRDGTNVALVPVPLPTMEFPEENL